MSESMEKVSQISDRQRLGKIIAKIIKIGDKKTVMNDCQEGIKTSRKNFYLEIPNANNAIVLQTRFTKGKEGDIFREFSIALWDSPTTCKIINHTQKGKEITISVKGNTELETLITAIEKFLEDYNSTAHELVANLKA